MTEQAPAHPAPTEPYRPLSGLAVLAFVLSLVSGLASITFWWLELIPFLVGIVTLATVRPEARRGRVLAVWGIVIAVAVGSFFYFVTGQLKGLVDDVSGSILGALSREQATDADKDAALAPWMYRPFLDEDDDLLPRIRQRFDHVVTTHGPYAPPPRVGGFFDGPMSLVLPPGRVSEITPDGEHKPLPQSGLWVEATFGTQVVHVLFQMTDGSPSFGFAQAQDHVAGSPVPLVGDVRFFVSEAERPAPR